MLRLELRAARAATGGADRSRRSRAETARSSARSACRRPIRAGVARARGARCRARAAGRLRLRSTSWSTKSSIASSAQCRSSNTSTIGRRSANDFEVTAPGGSALFRAHGPSLGQTGERTQVALDPLRLRCLDAGLTDGAGQLLTGLLGGVALEDARFGLDDLAKRPEGHAVAVWKRATLPPADERRSLPRLRARAPRRGGSCRFRAHRPGSPAAASAPHGLARASRRAARALDRGPPAERSLGGRRRHRNASAPGGPPRQRIGSLLPLPTTGCASR